MQDGDHSIMLYKHDIVVLYGVAAINGDELACDVARLLAGKKHGDVADLFRPSESIQKGAE